MSDVVEDEVPQVLVAIARTVLAAGVDQLQKHDLSKDEPELVVARIYVAMELAAMALEEQLADNLNMSGSLLPPIDKSKLN